MPERIPQSATLRVPLYAVLASDHVSAGTGLTLAITISKNGAAFGNPSAGATNATAIGSGWYYVDLSTTDTGTIGPLIVLGSAGTADPVTIAYNVVDATNGGLSNLDAAMTSRLSPTVAGRTLDVSTGGEAGVDWGNVGSPLSGVSLDNTVIGFVTTVNSAVIVGGATAGAISANAFATDAINANALATSAVTEIQTGLATSAQVTAISVPTAINNADALLDRADAVEVGLTPRQSLRVALAALGGKVSGGGTTTNTFRNAIADSKNRVVATVDANGNRTAITYDVT